MEDVEKWKLELVPYYCVFCHRCGQKSSIEGHTVEECVEILKKDGWKLRRVGPWCPGCVEDVRREYGWYK